MRYVPDTLHDMGLLKNTLLRRILPTGRATDAAMLAAAGLKFAQRRGLISPELGQKFGGLGNLDSKLSIGEMLLLAGALWRLVRRFMNRNSSQIITIQD